MNQGERRRHPRADMVAKVTHIKAGVDQYYYSRDISLGGMFLETRKPYPVGSEVELHFMLPGREHRIEVKGRVVRSIEHDLEHPDQTAGMGVEFDPLSEPTLAEITEHLK